MRDNGLLTARTQRRAQADLALRFTEASLAPSAVTKYPAWSQMTDPAYKMQASRLEDRLDALIKIKPTHEDSKRLSKRLVRYRSELTRFLWAKDLEGTNNPAERALRPAVVMRKITGGNRSESGAAAWAKLASLLRTADQRKLGVFDATKKLITDYWAQGGR